MNHNIDYKRISILGERIKGGNASKREKDEYMLLLNDAKIISSEQYKDYLTKQSENEAEQLIKSALIIGAIALIAYIISDLLSDS